jgi:EmrB/QacA subfamily drug resistance transporter
MKSQNIQSFSKHEYLIISTAGIGMFLASLDTGIINVALPTLTKTFNVSVSTITLTISLYTLALISFVVTFGKLSDIFGRIKIFSTGLVIFCLSSILCGLSFNAFMLIFFRIIQGLGAAMLQGTSSAMITTMIPQKKHTSALGLFAVFISLGPVLGPSIGGFLITLGGWPLIFFINIPISIVAFWGCNIIKKHYVENVHRAKINLIENLVLITIILTLLITITRLSEYGIFNFKTLLIFLIFIISTITFIYRELTINNPMLNLTIFTNIKVATLLISFLVLGGATSIIFIIPPYYLEQLKHLPTWAVGLINLSAPLSIAIFSQISGKNSEKLGYFKFINVGFCIMTIIFLVMTEVDENWPIYLYVILLFIYGIGGGLFIPPNTAITLHSVHSSEQGTIGAFQRMAQNIGIALYTSISSSLIANNAKNLIQGFKLSWLFAFCSLIIVLIVLIYVTIKEKSSD